MALTLGNKIIEFPFVLAPMAGITNAPFRTLMRELGAGVVISELISATGIEYSGKKTIELCETFENERPVGLQIFGEDPDHLVRAAKFVQAKGADFVDINLGCPVPKVVKKGGGAAMMRDPEKLCHTLTQVKQAIDIPLTIKIRTGWDACSINALECVQAAHEAKVTWVAIHGRTRAQGYEGHADWDLIAKIKEASPLPIIGNGDITTAEQAMHRYKTSGCDGIMIGRGIFGNPWLFDKSDAIIDLPTRLRTMVEHTLLFEKLLGDFKNFNIMKKHYKAYVNGFDGARELRVELMEAKNAQEVQETVEKFLA
jgi:nifR3 family TIM-barrel protein